MRTLLKSRVRIKRIANTNSKEQHNTYLKKEYCVYYYMYSILRVKTLHAFSRHPFPLIYYKKNHWIYFPCGCNLCVIVTPILRAEDYLVFPFLYSYCFRLDITLFRTKNTYWNRVKKKMSSKYQAIQNDCQLHSCLYSMSSINNRNHNWSVIVIFIMQGI